MEEGLVSRVCHGWVFAGVERLKREVVGGKQFTNKWCCLVDRRCFTTKHPKILKTFYIETNGT
jgi:hypothetical protein